jgi:hypothetical protein
MEKKTNNPAAREQKPQELTPEQIKAIPTFSILEAKGKDRQFLIDVANYNGVSEKEIPKSVRNMRIENLANDLVAQGKIDKKFQTELILKMKGACK